MAKTTRDSLKTHVGELAGYSALFLYLADAASDRLSISQAAFFMMAAAANARGAPLTAAQLQEAAGENISKNVKNSYRRLLTPSNANPGGLGWLDREGNPDDEREKFLVLTPKGEEVIKAALLAAAPISRAN